MGRETKERGRKVRLPACLLTVTEAKGRARKDDARKRKENCGTKGKKRDVSSSTVKTKKGEGHGGKI